MSNPAASAPEPPKISVAGSGAARLREVELQFMRTIEAKNKARAEHLSKVRRNNRWVASGLGATAVAIYFYSMWAVRQESFLDDFERPEKIIKQ